MPVAPSVSKAIAAVKGQIANPSKTGRGGDQIYFVIDELFRKEKIVADSETLGAVLALAEEVEGYRGKGSQSATREFTNRACGLVYAVKRRLPLLGEDEDRLPTEEEIEDRDVVRCLEQLGDYAFQRVQGPRVRSRRAASLRSCAWRCLAEVSEVLRRPAYLEFARKVSGDPKASEQERDGALDFLGSYSRGEEPDEATIKLLDDLEESAKSRDFLVSVKQAQIDLGIEDEFGAMMAVDYWEEEKDDD